MVAHAAIRIDAACSWTGVNTVLVQAGLVSGTVVIDDTFWPTIGRAAKDARQAGAVAAAIASVPGRVGVGPTGVGLTRIIGDHWFNC